MNTTVSDNSDSGEEFSVDFIASTLLAAILFLLMICLFIIIKMFFCDKGPTSIPIHPLESELE